MPVRQIALALMPVRQIALALMPVRQIALALMLARQIALGPGWMLTHAPPTARESATTV
jgi:hypothetical protein